MAEIWSSKEALEYTRQHGVGGAFALVREANENKVRRVFNALWSDDRVKQTVLGGFRYNLCDSDSHWTGHSQGLLYLLEAPHRRFKLDAATLLDKNSRGLAPSIRCRTVPLVLVTDKSHTIESETQQRNLNGPEEVIDAIRSRGALVLKSTEAEIENDLHQALMEILTGDNPENLLIP